MNHKEEAYCCTAVQVFNFDTADEEDIKRYLRDVEYRYKTSHKVIFALTSTGELTHLAARMIKDNQRAAEKSLRAEGFKCTKRMWNRIGKHKDAGVKMWWKAIGQENVAPAGHTVFTLTRAELAE